MAIINLFTYLLVNICSAEFMTVIFSTLVIICIFGLLFKRL